MVFLPIQMGRVSASYADGGVMGHLHAVAHDPSARDYAGTSPFEWGGRETRRLCDIPTTKPGRQEVPIAWAISPPAATPCGKLAGVSVSSPRIPRQSAFCSHFLLQVRRFVHDRKRQIPGTIFTSFFN